MNRLKKYFPPITILLFILLSSVILSQTMIKSGRLYDFGLGFWGPNGHDGIWHLSVINQISQKIPPDNPVMSGTLLKNYHWGFDLLIAGLSKITGISPITYYFQILPISFSLLIGLLSYILAISVFGSRLAGFFFVFLNYFAGSLGWLFTLIFHRQLGGESLFYSMQSASTLINPPYALSLILLLLGTIFFFQSTRSRSKFFFYSTIVCFSLLSVVKVYAGIIVGLGLVSALAISFLQKKSTLSHVFMILAIGILSFLGLLFFGAVSGSQLLIFKPFWFQHSIIESVDRLYFPSLASLLYNLSQNWFTYKLPVLISIELFLLVIFIIGNSSVRLFALSIIFKKISEKRLAQTDYFLYSCLFFALILPVLFIQKGTAWNTIQFFYYFLFILNFYLARFLSVLFRSHRLWVILILLFSFPTSAATLKDYFGYPPPATLPVFEIEALNFLKNQPGKTVLTYPYDRHRKDNINTPIPLYLYETTAYVSAFTGKRIFLEDEMNLDITGYDWQKRRVGAVNFFNQKEVFSARGLLVENQIDYIYLVGYQKNTPLTSKELYLEKIFENPAVLIYKVYR